MTAPDVGKRPGAEELSIELTRLVSSRRQLAQTRRPLTRSERGKAEPSACVLYASLVQSVPDLINC